MLVYFDREPQPIQYDARPDGKSDVWIRKNIEEINVAQDGETFAQWKADEEYYLTTESLNGFLEQMLSDFVQGVIDAKAQEKKYDSGLSVLSYKDSTNTNYKAEAEAFSVWRDNVWTKCTEVLNTSLQGTKYVNDWQGVVPSKEELLAVLPTLEW